MATKPPQQPRPVARVTAKPAKTPTQTAVTKPPPPGNDKKIEDAVRKPTARERRDALAWFHAMVKGQVDARGRARSSARRISADAFASKRGLPVIGQMYFYTYDPKWKDELPYWDKFPLVIPVKYYSNGWLGLNLHYAPPAIRAKVLDQLMAYTKAAKTERAFMKLSYPLLKSVVGLKMAGPMVKRYLSSHVETELVRVKDVYWARAAILPVQQFQKATSQKVWKEGYGK